MPHRDVVLISFLVGVIDVPYTGYFKLIVDCSDNNANPIDIIVIGDAGLSGINLFQNEVVPTRSREAEREIAEGLRRTRPRSLAAEGDIHRVGRIIGVIIEDGDKVIAGIERCFGRKLRVWSSWQVR